MIDEPASSDPRINPGKVTLRREAKVAEIVESAWELAREHGIAGVSLHALAREVGMRQPSLYAYFDSKHRCMTPCLLTVTGDSFNGSTYSSFRKVHGPLKEVLGRVRRVVLEDPAR